MSENLNTKKRKLKHNVLTGVNGKMIALFNLDLFSNLYVDHFTLLYPNYNHYFIGQKITAVVRN